MEGAYLFFLVMTNQVAEWSTARRADRRQPSGSWGVVTAVISFGGGAALAVAMLVSGARAHLRSTP
ncbi:hypothetical protein ACGFMK_35665 [Amycolatopsis sp. NPDC049252]|uniref:hypothetical protein n=1 Tax=Amycolatopsis sp. NPDC049252 TaxID=3363933 RepID=UPI00371A94DB